MSGVAVFILVTPANSTEAVASMKGESKEDGRDTPSPLLQKELECLPNICMDTKHTYLFESNRQTEEEHNRSWLLPAVHCSNFQLAGFQHLQQQQVTFSKKEKKKKSVSKKYQRKHYYVTGCVNRMKIAMQSVWQLTEDRHSGSRREMSACSAIAESNRPRKHQHARLSWQAMSALV